YSIGKGFHTYYAIQDRSVYGDLIDRVEQEDFSLLDKGRFLNLKKIYPDIPSTLNDVLMHFSRGANVYYEFVEEIIEDLNRCLYAVF
ncbi:MAG: protein kinase, partial [Deltaproteobacteria bacterium]|nr:protein kinase [Deltaproteobacteria bacterium]